MVRKTLRFARSTIPTLLFSSSATKRCWRARSMAIWSIRPRTSPSGILASRCRTPVADFLLHGKDCALRRGLLDDGRDRHLGHRQQRVVLRRPGDVFEIGEHLLLGSPRGCGCFAAILIEGIIFRRGAEALR